MRALSLDKELGESTEPGVTGWTVSPRVHTLKPSSQASSDLIWR